MATTNETKVVPIRPGPPWEKHPTPWRYEGGDIIDANGDSVEVSISQLRHLVAVVNAHGPMKEALGNLSRYVEQEIAAGRWRWNGDWACAECHPDSEILKPGFACARHAALALAQKVGTP